MKNLVITAAGLLLASGFAFAGEDPALAAALQTLRAAGRLDSEAIGYAGVKSETYQAFEVLRERAGVERLLELTGDESVIVRCYAVQALAERHPAVALGPVALRTIEDDTPVPTMVGCCMGTEKLGDVVLRMVWPRLDGKEMYTVLDQLLREESPLDQRDRVLRTRSFLPEWRPRIRGLAEDGVDAALIALARYRRAEDLDLIRTPLTAESRPFVSRLPALRAAALHGGADLMPVLEALAGEARLSLLKNSHHVRFWYDAVAAQESQRAAKLLTAALGDDGLTPRQRDRNAAYLFDAIAPHLVPAFRPLMLRLWGDHALLNQGVLAFLAREDATAIVAQARHALTKRLNRLPPEVVVPLLEVVLQNGSGNPSTLLTSVLREADVHHFKALAMFVADAGYPEQIPDLFARFENEKNPHLYLAAAKALLAYRRPAVREKLERLVKEREHLRTGWGGEELRRLLGM